MAIARAIRVPISTIQPSGLSTEFPSSSSSSCYHLSSTSNARFRSSPSSFPLKTCRLSASINDNPKPVTAEMKRMKIDEDSSEPDPLPEEKLSVYNKYMSNYGIMRSLVLVQIKWLIKLSQIPQVTIVPSFNEKSLSFLEGLIDKFDSNEDYRCVTRFARCPVTDVRAVCMFLYGECPAPTHREAKRAVRFSHHACTYEDLVKLAYAFSLKEAIKKVMLPIMDDLIRALCKIAKDNADVPMLCRTDNEPAATTMGKEIAVFAARLSNERHRLSKVAILGDFAGYSGNHNANVVAYPELDWQQIAKEFVEESLELTFDPYVGPHDYMIDLVYAVKRFSAILKEFFEDVQTYTSLGYFNQISEANEFKSFSTLHQVNHLDEQITKFRESRSFILNKIILKQITKDGEFGWSSNTLYEYAEKLPATLVIKKMGDGLMSYLLSYKVALLGIGKLQVNKACLRKDLDDWWEMLLEPAETVMQRYGIDLWRYGFDGEVTEGSFKEFISDNLEIPKDAKANLLKLAPHKYIGQAANIANRMDKIVHDLENTLNVL